MENGTKKERVLLLVGQAQVSYVYRKHLLEWRNKASLVPFLSQISHVCHFKRIHDVGQSDCTWGTGSLFPPFLCISQVYHGMVQKDLSRIWKAGITSDFSISLLCNWRQATLIAGIRFII